MRSSAAYLLDILEHISALDQFLAGKSFDEFAGDELLKAAVHSKLVIIGEAVSQLPDSLTARYSTVPWGEITRFRNLVIHGYFKINWDIMWETATRRVRELRDVVQEMLQKDFPDFRPEHE
jgi:uncharacterized protein with HEPN domain